MARLWRMWLWVVMVTTAMAAMTAHAQSGTDDEPIGDAPPPLLADIDDGTDDGTDDGSDDGSDEAATADVGDDLREEAPPPATTSSTPVRRTPAPDQPVPARPPRVVKEVVDYSPLWGATVAGGGALLGAIGGAGVLIFGEALFNDVASLGDFGPLVVFATVVSTPALASLAAGLVTVAFVVPDPTMDDVGSVAACSALGCLGTWLVLAVGLGGGAAGCNPGGCGSGDCNGCGSSLGTSSSSTGHSSDIGLPAAAGAGVGALAGLGAGFLVGVAAEDANPSSGVNERTAGALGMIAGGVIGGVIGGAITGYEVATLGD